MNKNYRSIWNEALGAWVAVSEIENAKGKPAGGSRDINRSFKRFERIKASLRVIPLLVCMTFSFSGNAYAAIAFSSVTSDGKVMNNGSESAQVDSKGASVFNYKNPGNLSYKDPENPDQDSNGRYYSPAGALAEGVAIGRFSDATSAAGKNGYANIAIGDYAQAKNGSGFALGSFSRSINTGATAIGTASLASGINSLAMMRQSAATGSYAMAIGTVAWAKGMGSLAMGHSSQAAGNQSIAIGSADAALKSSSITQFDNDNNTQAMGKKSIAIGVKARAEKDDTIAIGSEAKATKNRTIAVGMRANSSGENSVAFGQNSVSSGENSTAVGTNSKATGANSSAFGQASNASGQSSVVVGVGANASIAYSVSLGSESVADRGALSDITVSATPNNINQIYASELASETQKAAVAATVKGNLAAVSVGSNEKTRQIINVAAGSADSDAVNVAQLKAAVVNSQHHYYSVNATDKAQNSNFDNQGASASDALAAGVRVRASGLDSTAMGSDAHASGAQSLAMGNKVNAGGLGATAVGNNSSAGAEGAQAFGQSSVASGINSAALGRYAQATADRAAALGVGVLASGEASLAAGDGSKSINSQAVAIGKQAVAGVPDDYVGKSIIVEGVAETWQKKSDQIAIGTQAAAVGKSTVALGQKALAYKDHAIAVGQHSKAVGASSAAFGSGAKALQDRATALGNDAQASGSGSVAVGASANASGVSSAALGNTAAAQGEQALALGNNSIAINAKDVALGADSVTEAAQGTSSATVNNITYGNFAGATPAATVSVGSGNIKRTVTNVAAGRISADSTDAINGSQLYLTQQALGNVGGSIVKVLGGNAEMGTDGNIMMSNIGNTNENTVDAAIKAVNTQANNPLTFGGDNNGNNFNRKLGQELFVKGGATGELSNNNIAVESDGNNTLNVKLAKKLTGLTSVQFTDEAGKTTTVNSNGMTIVPANGQQVSLSENGLDNGDNKITNVANGAVAKGSKEVVTGDQLFSLEEKLTDSAASVLKGLDFAGNTGEFNRQMGEKVTVQGTLNANTPASGNNIRTAADNNGNINILLADAPTFAGKVSAQGLDAGGQKITNVDRGTDGTDAVNVKQLQDAMANLTVANQSLVQANSPFAYVNSKDEILVRHVDKDGRVSFIKADGGASYVGTDISISALNAVNPQTATPTTINNVAAGKADDDVVNVSQLKNIIATLGGGAKVNQDGTIERPVYQVNNVSHRTVGDAVSALNETVRKPLTFGGDKGNNFARELGSEVFVKGGARGELSDSNIAVVSDATNTLEVRLAKELANLTSAQFTDAAGNSTTVSSNGIAINPTNGKTPVSLSENGLNNGGNKITNVAPGKVLNGSSDAVNGSQLYSQGEGVRNIIGGSITFNPDTGTYANSDIGGTGKGSIDEAIRAINTSTNAGWNLTAQHANSSKVASGNTVDLSNTDGNIVIAKTSDSNNVTFELAKNITVDGVTTGKGDNQVMLGNEGVKVGGSTYISNDGLNANDKVIGNVVAGKDGKDAVNVSQLAPLAQALGMNVNPNTGAVSAPNLVVTKAAGSKHNSVSTIQGALDNIGEEIQKPLTFGGDKGDSFERKLGSEVFVKGGAQGALSDRNIAVVSNANNTLDVKLAKDLADLTSTQFIDAAGNRTIVSGNGITINPTSGKAPVSLSENGLDNGGNKITNVANGTVAEGSQDAVTGDQLFNLNKQLENNIGSVSKGLNFAGNTGEFNRQMGEKVTVKGGLDANTAASSSNIRTSADEKGNIEIMLADAPTFAGKVSAKGFDAGGQKITNVEKGTDAADAVNVEQLQDALANQTITNQNLVQANSTFSYVNEKDEILIRHVAKDGKVSFTKAANGEIYSGTDIRISALNATDPQTAVPTIISNVADGRADDDAVNVSQLKDIVSSLGGGAQVKPDGSFEQPVYTVNTRTHRTVGDAVTALGEAVQKPLTFVGDNDTVKVARKLDTELAVKGGAKGKLTDNNIGVTGSADDHSLTIKLAEKINLGENGSVQAGNSMLNNSGLTIQAPGKQAVSLSGNGLNNGGNVIANIAAGKDSKDAVNVSQLTPLAQVLGVNVEANSGMVSAPNFVVTKADGSKYNGVPTIQGALDNIGTEIQKPLSFGGDSGNNFNRKLGEEVLVKGGVTDHAKLSDNNIGIVSNGNGTLEVKLAKDIAVDSVAAGNTIINNDGVKVGKIHIGINGIDAGGKKVSNVAAGENDTDAVNMAQLKSVAAAASSKVKAGKNMEIVPVTNTDGSTTYNVATKDGVEFAKVTIGNPNGNHTILTSGANGLDVGNSKITNVAAGNISLTSTDAVNGSQLFNAGRKVADALGGGSTVDTNGNVTAPAYALTGGNPAKGESKTYNNVGEALNGLDKAVNQPLTFAADSGSNVERKLGSTFNVNGDNSNIRTETTADGVKVALNDQISVKQVQVADGPTINNNGIAMNNQQITGLKSGLDGKTIDQIKTEGSSSAQWNNAATVGDLASVQNTVTNITNITNNILGTDDGKGNSYTNNKGELTEAGKLALKTYDVSGQTATNDNTVISAIKNMNEGGIKYFHTNDDSGQTTGGVVHDTDDSSASGKFATAVGFNAAANSENALAIGKGAKALAENALAIGTGNVVSGRNSGAIGDPSTISGNNSYSLGNNNTVATDNTFVLGNSVAQTVANSVVLGNESAAVEVHKAVAGSSNYTYKGENDANVAGVKDVVGVVSVGKDGQTRQIQNVAAGVVSATSTDAINGSQLYYTNKAIEEVKGGGAGIVQYSSPANPTQPNGGTASNDVTLVGGNPNAPVVIHNVGAGSAPTDAVNVGQLMAVGNHLNQRIEDTGRRANAGTASAMAMAGLPQAYLPGKSMVAVAGSTYRGESGYALGVSSISDNGNWIIKGTASGNSRGHYGATAGVGYQW